MIIFMTSCVRGGQMFFVDGGAWRGDTIEKWARRFGDAIAKIWAFEPDEAIAADLHAVISRLGMESRVEVITNGLYDKNVLLRFKKTDEMIEISEEGDRQIRVQKLDDVLPHIQGDLYIKMDLEGSEMAALRGAKKTIKKYHPIMAICTYHRMEDILHIPQYIASIVQGYRFYLRAGFHTECYAVPAEYTSALGWCVDKEVL